MILTLALCTALADDGRLVLSWKKDLGTVQLEAPAGEHLADGAPTHLAIETAAGRYTVDWGDLAGGIQIPLGAGGPVEGEVTYSLCTDGGTACRVVDLAFSGAVSGKKGEIGLVRAEVLEPSPTPVRHLATAEDAFAQAAASGRPVLIDFGAEWCPPCQVLEAEILADPDNASDLAPYVVLAVDADHPDSWPLKDRYAVGGYPTVLVVTADGSEIGRHLGYSTEAEFLGWLGTQQGQDLDVRLAAADTLDPDARGALALALLASNRDDDARTLLDDTTGTDAALARFQLDPDPTDVPDLLAAAPDRWSDWIWSATRMDLPPDTVAALRALLAAEAANPDADGAALAYLSGHFAADPADSANFAALGARIVAAEQTGVPAHDRGYWLDQASFLEDAGQVDAAVVVLQQGVDAWPDEFTWPYNIAGYLQRAGRHVEALTHAQAARPLAYGDQTLRASAREAQLLMALDRQDEARALVAETLAAAHRPAQGIQVRTLRYLATLEALQAELAAL